ncbi:cytosolic carboxypeptidase 1-like isoform X2 [Littorina saxatilis]|uniref:cytosolic carboxypeptidase 1-like isoform X2 n=1 Tax=Littorina saxatilis TaxID=31220 RepID=UPI0038B4D37F
MAQSADNEKTPDRSVAVPTGTRLNNLFQLIDKSLCRMGKKTMSEDLQHVRYASSKLLQLLSAQDKLHKDLVFKQAGLVDILVNVLQQVSDENTLHNTISIFNELLGKSSGKRATMLVNHGLAVVVFGILKQVVCQEISLSEEVLVLCHSVLAKIGHKDRKFGVKARLHRTLLLTLNLIKNNTCSFRFLQPLLQVLKLYTANSVNASYLGKHNAINIMFRIISTCGRKHVVCCKLAFENLSNMTKSKSNSARLIGMGGVPLLLGHHSDWHQADAKNRNISLRKAILNTLKNITNLKSGRQAFVESDGIRVLYNSAQDVSDSREVESLIMLASLIMRKCCPRNRLPLDNVLSAVTFSLPHSDVHIPECYTLAEFQATMSISARQSGDDSDHSSLDDDDDIDSDDERFRTDHPDESEDDTGDGLEPPEVRSMDELRMYDKFFPEVFEFDHFLSPMSEQDSAERISLRDREQSLLGLEDRLKGVQTGRRVEYSVPASDESSSSSLRSRLCETSEPVTAVNMKTGYSVVSLDFPTPSGVVPSTARKASTLSSSSKTSYQKGSSTSRKGKPAVSKKALQAKDKKLKKIPSVKGVDEFTDALCITSLATPRDYAEDGDQATNSSSEDLEEDNGEIVHDPRVYTQMARETNSVYRFEKMAFPDLNGGLSAVGLEPLYSRKFGVQRSKVFEDIDRMIHPETIYDHVVYDLDSTVTGAGAAYCQENSNLSNRDELRVGRQEGTFGILRFNAQFECGNLRKVIQVREFEYDLILNPDINTNHHHQWFYFEVSNMAAGINYRFNIVNCEKLNSQFNFGMQPVMFSVAEAAQGRAAWTRVGTDICYYRNHFLRSSQTTGGVKGKAYYTTTFTVRFMHNCDVCYLAYHYPYTYTMLRTHLFQWEGQVDQSQVFFRYQNLCETLGGNQVPVLTITAQPRSNMREDVEELWSRPYIFLSGRVHPGESNSSWVMKGTVDFLMSNKPAAQQLRERYIFKVVPMLNPDGVINGNHRSSLVAEDLNRRWLKPCPRLHPTIYHTKGLLQYLSTVNKTPLVYCDYHGHSRKKNIFMYGCSPQLSWMNNDTQNPVCTGNKAEDNGFKTLPRILHLSSPPFSLQNCSFVLERGKEATARVVVWRQIGVVRSYTMESSYCGCDQGKYKDQHLNTRMLEEMGHKFCEGLLRLAKTCTGFDQQLPDFGASTADFGSFEGLEDGEQDGFSKPTGASCLFEDTDLASFSDDDDRSGDDEENYGEDDIST